MRVFDKTIQMYIFDGNPNGRIMCELSNWNGRVYKVSRNELAAFSKREDAENTGVYFLFGKDEQNNDTVYIGEAEKVFSRLKQHIGDVSYWNDCVVVISQNNLLNKAHVKYLENTFYQMAQNSSRAVVINSTVPTRSSVSEYDQAMLEEFIENAKLLVNTLGYKVFETIEETVVKRNDNEVVFYAKAARGADAKGMAVSDGFVVLKGSRAAAVTTPSASSGIIQWRQTLREKNVMDESFVFQRDYVFSSPSTAASVVLGRSANGLIEWQTENRQPLKTFYESSFSD